MAWVDEVKRWAQVDWGTWLNGVYDYNVRSRAGPLPPKLLQVIVNYRCNARCAMCNIWQMRPERELSLEEFARIMEDEIFHGIERLTVAGGETSLRKDLVPLVSMFLDHMPNVKVLSTVTNGFLTERIMADVEQILQACQARGIHFSISVSLDGIGELHDRIRRVPGGFAKVEQTLEGLKALQGKYDFWMGVGYTVMRQNLRHARQFRSWCEERNIPYGFQLVGFHDTYVSNLELQEELDFGEGERAELITFMEELASQRSLRNFTAFYWDDMVHMYRDGRPRQTPCPFSIDGLVLDSLGDVYYCLSSPKIGNVLDEGRSVSEIYYAPESLAFREHMKQRLCPGCNSACEVEVALKKNVRRYMKFLLTGQTGPTAMSRPDRRLETEASVPVSS